MSWIRGDMLKLVLLSLNFGPEKFILWTQTTIDKKRVIVTRMSRDRSEDESCSDCERDVSGSNLLAHMLALHEEHGKAAVILSSFEQ